MRPKRPINADVPASEAEEAEKPAPKPEAEERKAPKPEVKEKKAPKSEREEKRAREPKPLAPKLLAGLVVLALVFIVVAILGSNGGDSQQSEPTSPAPAPAPPVAEDAGESAPSQTAESLGYPTFATNNTTRIGGSDVAATAAAVALAVFPSTTPSQRPAAVTLVSEEDWAGAIAASVLMAAPVRAPVLFSRADEIPDATAEALEALAPQGGKATGGAALFALGEVALPDGTGNTSRIDSGDPASTAAQIATLRDRLAGGPPDALIVAPSAKADIAMPAAAWAARSGDPVLYTEADALSQPTAATLKRHPKASVYVLGPASAVSAEVLREIGKIAKRVKRVSGEGAIANALAFARFSDGGFGWDVKDPGHGFVLARSDSPLDAAAAAPLSGSGTWGPLLLTDNAGTLPPEVRSYFLDVKPGYTTNPTRAFYNRVWVIGDQEAIDVNQQAEVNELAELAQIGGEG